MSSKPVKRAYKYRFYPTPEQADLLNRTFGCVRVVWNEILQRRTMRYRIEGASTSFADSSRMLTALKKEPEFEWLNDASAVPLQQTLRHQHRALQGFFEKRTGYPRFKTCRRSRPSATYVGDAFSFRGGLLRLAKMSGPLDIRWSRPLPKDTQPSSVTVSRDSAGRWFISLLVEVDIRQLKPNKNVIGIDLGVRDMAITSTGEKFTPDFACKQQRVKHWQKRYSRTEQGSQRREKARRKVARAHARVADARRDFLHQTSTRIIRENQTVVLEDLAVKAMTRSSRGTVENPGKRVRQKAGLNRGMLNHSFGEFRQMIQYKADWYGREVIIADRFYPSSKTCSACGFLLDKLDRGAKQWTCPNCKSRHDRDINAAKNLVAFALGQGEKRNARGGPVSPLDLTSSGTAR